MASTDWNFTYSPLSSSGGVYVGGISGSAVNHAAVPSPLTGFGTYCRGFAVVTNGTRPAVAMSLNSVPQLSSSLGLSYGYTYSLRTWVNIGGGGSNNGFHLVFKGTQNFNIQDPAAAMLGYDFRSYMPSGYKLFINENNLFLECRTTEGSSTAYDSIDPSLNASPYRKDLTTLGSFTTATWKRYRMDVVGLGNLDRITIYTGNIAGTWTQIHTVDITQTKTGAYIPWAVSGNPNGSSAVTPNGRGCVGYLLTNNNSISPTYIDQFEAYREVLS
jgi:hypothetical protein